MLALTSNANQPDSAFSVHNNPNASKAYTSPLPPANQRKAVGSGLRSDLGLGGPGQFSANASPTTTSPHTNNVSELHLGFHVMVPATKAGMALSKVFLNLLIA